MIGRACLAAFVAAATFTHFLAPSYLNLPAWVWLVAILLALLLALRFPLGYVLVFACLGSSYSVWHIQDRLNQAVPAADINKVSRVELEIQSLVQMGPAYRQFQARVLSAQPPGLPEQIQVRWNATQRYSLYREPVVQDFPKLMPGQRWRMSLLVRPPRGARNPHGFDAERHAITQGWRAVGSVRGQPQQMEFDPAHSWATWTERLRHSLRTALMPYVQERRWGGVMLALSLGDQASIAAPDWVTFNRSGLTHLVSISGTHVTFLAVLLAGLVSWCWRRIRWRRWALAEQIPAQIAATWVGIAGAGAYCVIAGWGVPAQRTFLMLLVLGLCRIRGLHLGVSRILLIAARSLGGADNGFLSLLCRRVRLVCFCSFDGTSTVGRFYVAALGATNLVCDSAASVDYLGFAARLGPAISRDIPGFFTSQCLRHHFDRLCGYAIGIGSVDSGGNTSPARMV